MLIPDLLNDKTLKTKEKTEILSSFLVDKKISVDELILFAKDTKDPVKGTCIEALEYATKKDPSFGSEEVLKFASESLSAKAPRVKWESAKVIGNIAHRFPTQLDKAITNLLDNSEHEGTVVRWSAAFALGEILKMKTKHNSDLLPAFEAIINREEKNSIKKIYQDAIMKSK